MPFSNNNHQTMGLDDNFYTSQAYFESLESRGRDEADRRYNDGFYDGQASAQDEINHLKKVAAEQNRTIDMLLTREDQKVKEANERINKWREYGAKLDNMVKKLKQELASHK